MCATCKTLYPDGDTLPERCMYEPRVKDATYKYCGGILKAVKCLKCLDSGKVTIYDPRSEPKTEQCPGGCKHG